jgi:hypothetical protein
MVISTSILNTYKELTLRDQVLNSDVFTEHLGFLVFWITRKSGTSRPKLTTSFWLEGTR